MYVESPVHDCTHFNSAECTNENNSCVRGPVQQNQIELQAQLFLVMLLIGNNKNTDKIFLPNKVTEIR